MAKPGDLIVLLGAGSIGSIAGSVLSALGSKELNACHSPGRQAFSTRAPEAGAQARRTYVAALARGDCRQSSSRLRCMLATAPIAVVAALEMFHVDQINVRGNHRLSKGEVLAMLQGLRGRSVLAVDLAEWRQALLSSPWVADASLRRTLPSTVDVVILERAPLGIGRINGSLYLVDDRGAVIDEYGPNYADLDLPIIDGLSGHSNARRGGAPRTNATCIARCSRGGCWMRCACGTWRRRFRRSTSAIRGTPSCCWKAIRRCIRLGNERFVERLQSYYELAPALRERVPAIDYVDLRFDERVYVRPAREGRAAARRRQDGAGKGRKTNADGLRGSMASRERYVVGLDIGTSKVAAIVGEMMDDGSLEIIGIGVSESKGIRRGAVVNLEAAVDSIKHAVDEAELMAGVEVDTVYIAISGPHIKGFNSRGVIAVAGKNREITRDDVRRAIDAAKAVALPTGQGDPPRAAAGLRRRRSGWHRRAGRHDGRPPRSERPHRDRRHDGDAERRRVRESRRHQRRRHGHRAARGQRGRADAG